MIKRTLLVSVLSFTLMPTSVSAQMNQRTPIPMVVDLKKVEVGSWATYSLNSNQMTMRGKFALVARDASSVTMENSIEGGMMAMMGGKMTLRVVMDPDPSTAARPIKQAVMQIADQDPMVAPDTMQMPKYAKPDPTTLVGKETIKVPAGSFKTSHYRYQNQKDTVDVWVSEDVPPTGMVKLVASQAQAGQRGLPSTTMELTAKGKGAKPSIVKPPRPYDASRLMGGDGPKRR